jgi:hypothetical protein
LRDVPPSFGGLKACARGGLWLLLCKYYQIGGASQCGALGGDEDTEPREVM